MVEHANEREETLDESNISPSSSREYSNGWRRRASMPLLPVTCVMVLLVVLLSACGGASASAATSQATSTPKIKTHDTCNVQATLPADIPPNGTFDTGANVIATFNNARQQEGCAVPLGIDPAAYDAATPQMQEFMLVNAERQDRGLGVLQLDTTLMSQIDINHSTEMSQYNYQAHSSPINQPGGNNGPFDRLNANPAITGHNDGLGENIAWGWGAAQEIYSFIYQDSASQWEHRQNILGYSGGTPGNSTWIGIGIATGGKWGFYSTLDFLDDANSTKYTPPPTADTQPPTMNPPTVVDANTVQVTGVADDSDGGTAGVAGVTSVVFYVGSALAADGSTFQTVVATQTSPGTWTANLAVTDPTMLHAVVVDGSGNYTDCVGGGATC